MTKIIAVAQLEGREPVRCSAALVYLRLLRNPGAAFSMATGFTWVLSLIAIAVVVVIVRDGAAAALHGLGGGARPGARRRAGQPDRPDLPRPGSAAGPRRGLRLAVRAQRRGVRRCSTWPTRRSSSAACCSCVLALLGRELDGIASTASRKTADERDVRAAAGARRARRHAGRRRARPPARPVPHRRRDPGRGRARRGRRAGRGASPTGSSRAPGWRSPCPSPSGRADRGAARGRRGPHDPVRGRRHRGGRQAGRGRRAPEPGLDRARPCSAGSPRSATASPPRARPSGRASCTGWTSAPPA